MNEKFSNVPDKNAQCERERTRAAFLRIGLEFSTTISDIHKISEFYLRLQLLERNDVTSESTKVCFYVSVF